MEGLLKTLVQGEDERDEFLARRLRKAISYRRRHNAKYPNLKIVTLKLACQHDEYADRVRELLHGNDDN